jgi:membrane-associated phospholipid phosphatase
MARAHFFPVDTGPSRLAALRLPIDPRLAPLYRIGAVASLAPAMAVMAGWFGVKAEPLAGLVMVTLAVGALGIVGRGLGARIVPDICEQFALFCVAALVTPLCCAMLATTNAPLADAALARADALFFGFDRRTFAAAILSSRWLSDVMRFAYGSIFFQPFLLLVLLNVSGRDDRARRFLGAWFVALIVATAIFPFVPAISNPPYEMGWVKSLLRIRSGELRVFDADALTGMIAFPSFHAAAAVLLAWGYRGFGLVGVPMVILNALMIVSAIPGGGHYLVDLIAGAIVAAAAIPLGSWLTRDRAAARA